jgi:hypothetical protein
MLRVDFSRVGGDLNILGTYPSFDTTLQWLEEELSGLQLP